MIYRFVTVTCWLTRYHFIDEWSHGIKFCRAGTFAQNVADGKTLGYITLTFKISVMQVLLRQQKWSRVSHIPLLKRSKKSLNLLIVCKLYLALLARLLVQDKKITRHYSNVSSQINCSIVLQARL